MIVNGKNIQGIWSYLDTAEYEKGDFVIFGSGIYIAKSRVSGKDPENNPEFFKPYLGDKISSLEEYLEYVSNNDSSAKDKYITSQVLSKVLSNYLYGLSDKGIIKEFIVLNGDNESGVSATGELESLVNEYNSTNILTGLIKSEINNACILVDRNLPEIDRFLSKIPPSPAYNEVDRSSIVLRQYTYTDRTNGSRKVRIQELIDHINGVVLFRHAYGLSFEIISTWKSSFLDIDFKNQVDYVKNYYLGKLTDLEKYKLGLDKDFGFRNVKFPKGTASVTLQSSYPNSDGYIDLVGASNLGNRYSQFLITVIVQEPVGSGVFKNHTLTIDLFDSIPNPTSTVGVINNYKFSDSSSGSLFINNASLRGATLSVQGVSGARIVNIYYRKFFKS